MWYGVMTRRFWFLMILLSVSGALALLWAQGNGEEPEFVEIWIGGHRLYAELAQTPEERRQGLMYREALPEDRGMLFIFEKDKILSFWMKNTAIPLSLAYLSRDGIIREIHHLKPGSLAPVTSRRSVRYALEVNRGWFQERGIRPGDKVEIPDY